MISRLLRLRVGRVTTLGLGQPDRSGQRGRGVFGAGHGHGFDEVLLDDEIEEEYGQGGDGRGGHDGVPALFGEGVVAGEGGGEGGEFVAADDEEGRSRPSGSSWPTSG